MKKWLLIFVCLLLVTTILFTLLGGYLKYKLLAPLGMYQGESLIAVPFMFLLFGQAGGDFAELFGEPADVYAVDQPVIDFH